MEEDWHFDEFEIMMVSDITKQESYYDKLDESEGLRLLSMIFGLIYLSVYT